MPVNADQFRDALRCWASGVSIVTTRRDGEGILGITVSSFSSLSLDPPLVVICIAREARSHDLIAARRAFAVNILREDQRPLSDRAAGREGEEGNWLKGVAWRRVATGAPVLEDCLAWLDCALVASHDGGDHTLFVGRVEAAGQTEGGPLLWFNSAYQALAPATSRNPSARRRRSAGRR